MAYDTYGAWYDGALVGAFEIKEGGELSYLSTQRLQKQRYCSQKC